MKRHKICELVGALIVGLTVCYVFWKQDASLSWLSFIGLVVIFLDRFPALLSFLLDTIRGTRYLKGYWKIYEFKQKLLRSAKKGNHVYFYSPILCYGVYSLGMSTFVRLKDEISSAVKRGVHVKILCDAYDLKTFKALLCMLDAGAQIRIVSESDPFRYFLVNSSKGMGIRPVTQDVLCFPGLGEFRPMSDRAQLLKRVDVTDCTTVFENDWDKKARPLTTDLFNKLKLGLLEYESQLLKKPENLEEL